MSNDIIFDDDFLQEMMQELRLQIPQINESLSKCSNLLEDSPLKSIQEILRIVHSLRGDTATLGLNFFSSYLKEIESLSEFAIEKIKDHSIAFGYVFGITECLEDLKLYLGEVTLSPQEDGSFFKNRSISLQVLKDILEFREVSTPEETQNNEGKLQFTLPEEIGPVERLYTIGKIYDSWVAFPIENITEVVKAGKINPLPVSKNELIGFFNHKGEVLPLLNPERLVDTARAKADEFHFHMICEVGDQKFGIATNQVLEVISIPLAEIKKLEIGNKLYQGVWKAAEDNYLILNPENIFVTKNEFTKSA